MSTTVDDLIALKDAAVTVVQKLVIYLLNDGMPKPTLDELEREAKEVVAFSDAYDAAEEDDRCSSMNDLADYDEYAEFHRVIT